MKRNTFSILFFVRKTTSLKNGESPLFVRITINGKRADISLKRSINAKEWDTKKSKCKPKSRSANELNHYIDSVQHKIMSIANDLVEHGQLTANKIKDIFNGNVTERTILKIFADHNEKCKKLIGIDMAEGTIERYITSYKHTEEFIK